MIGWFSDVSIKIRNGWVIDYVRITPIVKAIDGFNIFLPFVAFQIILRINPANLFTQPMFHLCFHLNDNVAKPKPSLCI